MPGRAFVAVVFPLALHGAARQVDAAVGLLLHTTLDLPDFIPVALGFVEPGPVARSVAGWVAGGCALWLFLAGMRRRAVGESWTEALDRSAGSFLALLLRPVLTLLALASLLIRPTYPYGFTLPVALSQDWSLGQDLAAAAFVLAPTLSLVAARVRIPWPRPWEVGFAAFLAYGLLTPAWARQWEAHTGNEPKTLRMAVALGHSLSLDVEGVSAPMEHLQPLPLAEAVGRAASGLVAESWAMLRALARGSAAAGRDAIRATRITRQTVRGKDGGVYYVLAPGPSLLIAPLLRLDRAFNLAAGTPGRLAMTLLAWNALSAVLIVGLVLLVRDLTGRPRLAAGMAAGFALLPPFYFYSYQFYPEMLGALALVFILRALLATSHWGAGGAFVLGLLLAALPWLHQKFLPVWAVLSVWAVIKAVDELTPGRGFLGLLIPQVGSLALFALYNFAITGSARPDAVYLAWGPGGVNPASTVHGVPGLLFDARYGLMPYVPVYLAAGAGLLTASRAGRLLRLAVPAAAVYYLTVASADNWSGAGCNLGRYVMPVAPLLVALVAVAAEGMTRRPGALGLALTLAAWSAVTALLLGLDPHAANDCMLLFARSAFADGSVYVPILPVRHAAEAAPGLWMRVGVWTALAAAAAWALRPRGSVGAAVRTLAGLLAVVLVAALVLERHPPSSRYARFTDGLEVRPGQVVFALDGARFEGASLVAEPGDVTLLLRQRGEGALSLLAAGEGLLRLPPNRTFPLTPLGIQVPLDAEDVRELTGRRGTREVLARIRFSVDSPRPVAMRVLP